jgi:hypothetical protein
VTHPDRHYRHFLSWLTLLFLLALGNSGFAQTTVVSGFVLDAETKDPVPFASVYFKNAKGVTADSTGYFEVSTARKLTEIIISYIGYKSKTIQVTPGISQRVVVDLSVDNSKDLGNVVIKSKKRIHYRNKGNPAVELIRRVIENRDKNKPEFYDYVEYELYEKLELSLNSNVTDKISERKMAKKFEFFFDNVDTTKVPGKTLVPIYLEEKISQNYLRKDPKKHKVIVEGDRKVNFGEYIDSAGVSSFLNRLYEDVDIYENNVSLFTREFLSPIANMAPTFYMFFIRDTVTQADGKKLVKMYFTPRNTNDFLFRGTMFITLDSNYAVQKLDMTVSPNINLNLVHELFIRQEFEQNPADGKFHVIKSDIIAEASISKGQNSGIFGERSLSYKNYIINQPREDKFYDGRSKVVLHHRNMDRDSFWMARRHDTLTKAEALTYVNVDSLRNMPSFRRMMNVANLLVSGYTTFPKFEIGPAAAFYAYNPIEGFRLRFGGRTTPGLSKRIYFESYGAYGFGDKRWKGFLGVTYSLNNKSIYSFPLNFIRASAQHETKIPGQQLQFVQEDNFLLSIKRGDNNKLLYNTTYKLDYVHEMFNHLSYSIGVQTLKQEPAGAIEYKQEQDGNIVTIPELNTTELSAELRWAPHEQFYQGTVYRRPIINKYPIFTLRYNKGVKGLLNGAYDYDEVRFAIQKRVYISQFGNSDVIFEGGHIFGQVPYPLLTVHRANQTFAYQLASYNLMNFLEFVSDRYVSLNIDHHFNGFIFNRIPLLRKLKLREVATAKFLFGGVRSENNPANNSKVFQFPVIDGVPTTYTLDNGPYIEGSVGINNIFKLLRLDLVRRFTYLDHPNVPKWGVRFRVKFEF